MPPHRKRVKHFHEAGNLHEFTFSCYRRRPLLTNDAWRRRLAESIDQADSRFSFQLIAFVFMPEHVHLLVLPLEAEPSIGCYLAAVKRPVSAAVKGDLERSGSSLLASLTIQDRPGKTTFRYWQEGPGYDRNLRTVDATLKAIDYVHANPVRRGLCARAVDWKWSSARWFADAGRISGEDLPKFSMLPADFGYRIDSG